MIVKILKKIINWIKFKWKKDKKLINHYFFFFYCYAYVWLNDLYVCVWILHLNLNITIWHLYPLVSLHRSSWQCQQNILNQSVIVTHGTIYQFISFNGVWWCLMVLMIFNWLKRISHYKLKHSQIQFFFSL